MRRVRWKTEIKWLILLIRQKSHHETTQTLTSAHQIERSSQPLQREATWSRATNRARGMQRRHTAVQTHAPLTPSNILYFILKILHFYSLYHLILQISNYYCFFLTVAVILRHSWQTTITLSVNCKVLFPLIWLLTVCIPNTLSTQRYQILYRSICNFISLQ